MRYLTAKPRQRKKRLIRQPSAATFSRRRRHIYNPPVLAFFPSTSRQQSKPPFPRRGRRPRRPASNEKLMIYLPSRLRFVWIARSRSIVTHEREYRATFLPRRGRRPRRPARPIPTDLPSSHPCLLLLEKGDRSAVDEECALSPADLPSTYPPLPAP